jgi:hypothetical protein
MTEAAREAMEAPPDEDEELIRARAVELLGPEGGAVADAWKDGRELDLAAAVTLAADAL